MGHQRDHAIIVSAFDFPESKEQIEWAHETAKTIFGEHRVCDMIGPKHITNGRMSFFIAPDGSKEGRQESDENNGRMARFCDWMHDNTPYVKFAEVAFADESNLTPTVGRYSEEFIPDDQRGF